TLGFQTAGFHPLAGVELDPFAARSHAKNFHGSLASEDPERFAVLSNARDITKLDPADLLPQLGYGRDTNVDVIIGGPPCPAFTRVGRAKLREVHQHPNAYKQDPRWKLYLPYLRFVEDLKPAALVMENVPDLMNFGGQNLAEEIAAELDVMGYEARYTLLNAAFFGVPQMRDRFILVALDKRLGLIPEFPKPTHYVELPSGYLSSRSVATRLLRSDDSQLALSGVRPWNDERFVEPPLPSRHQRDAVTIGEALGDLPDCPPKPRGPRRMDILVPYGRQARTEYERLMRTWNGFETEDTVTAHETRSLTERDYRIFAKMKPGDDYPAAYRIAHSLYEQEVTRVGAAAAPPMRDYVPPYDPTKFPNKWRKMDPSMPARTLMAHLGKDSYTHIHYSSTQSRVLTVREAARLQSFPDGFQFEGTMNPAFRQVGNAVPPLLALAVARSVKRQIEEGLGVQQSPGDKR
ncbi:MAG: DNA cytosine methyltransferase, partial [Myxococcales bacterium]|nr:DNA cytosine methyltransferase [Myxococcales bacterium]